MAFDPFCVIFVELASRVTEKGTEHVHGYMAVSDVGRMAIGSSRSDWPLDVSQSDVLITYFENIRPCNPSDFGGETLDVILFSFENLLRDEHREIRILYTKLLDLRVKPFYTVCQHNDHRG